MMAGLIRVSVAALVFWLIWPFSRLQIDKAVYADKRLWLYIVANGFGLSFGVYLLLAVLKLVGLRWTILSSFGPVMILPLCGIKHAAVLLGVWLVQDLLSGSALLVV